MLKLPQFRNAGFSFEMIKEIVFSTLAATGIIASGACGGNAAQNSERTPISGTTNINGKNLPVYPSLAGKSAVPFIEKNEDFKRKALEKLSPAFNLLIGCQDTRARDVADYFNQLIQELKVVITSQDSESIVFAAFVKSGNVSHPRITISDSLLNGDQDIGELSGQIYQAVITYQSMVDGKRPPSPGTGSATIRDANCLV
ncbi:MAG: hypothetical protein AAB512_02320 [Patescibacteria group bacterium]